MLALLDRLAAQEEREAAAPRVQNRVASVLGFDAYLEIQQLESKCGRVQQMFFYMSTFLGVLCRRMGGILQYVQTQWPQHVQKSVEVADEWEPEEVPFERLYRQYGVEAAAQQLISAAVLGDHFVKHYLRTPQLVKLLAAIQQQGVAPQPLIEEHVREWKQTAFVSMERDLERSFATYKRFYEHVWRELQVAHGEQLSSHRFRAGDSLTPSPSKRVQRIYQKQAARFQMYFKGPPKRNKR